MAYNNAEIKKEYTKLTAREGDASSGFGDVHVVGST